MIPYRVQVDNVPVDGYAIVYNAASPDQHLYAPVASPTYVNAGDLATLNSAKAYTDASVATLTGTLTEVAQDAIGASLVDSASVDFTYTDAANQITAVVLPAGVNHNALANLAVGDVHTQYALLAGRAAGQTLYGGTGAGESLILHSTFHATKGKVQIGGSFAYDGALGFVGLGTLTPASKVNVSGNVLAAAWGLSGVGLRLDAATYTDSGSPTGTVASVVAHSFGVPTLAANNANVVYTDAATLYIAGGPLFSGSTTGTNVWGLWNAGKTRLDGDVSVAWGKILFVGGIGTAPFLFSEGNSAADGLLRIEAGVATTGVNSTGAKTGWVYTRHNNGGSKNYWGADATNCYWEFSRNSLYIVGGIAGNPSTQPVTDNLQYVLIDRNGSIVATGQGSFGWTGSAASDKTQDALRIQPTAAQLADYRGLSVYPTSGASSPVLWTTNLGLLSLQGDNTTANNPMVDVQTSYVGGAYVFRALTSNTGTSASIIIRMGSGTKTADITYYGDGNTAVNYPPNSLQISTVYNTEIAIGSNAVKTFAVVGGSASLCAQTSTQSRYVATLTPTWTTSTDASRKGRLTFYANDSTALREAIRIESDGTTAFTTIPATVPATANYGLLSVGGGAWDGATAGFFSGVASGTLYAGNAATGFAGSLIDIQVAGAKPRFLVNSGEVRLDTATGGSVAFTGRKNGVAAFNLGVGAPNDILTLQNNVVTGDTQHISRQHIFYDTAGTTELFRINGSGLLVKSLKQHALTFTGSASNDLTQYSALIQPSGALAANWGPFAIALSSSQTVPEVSIDKYGSLVIAKAGVTVNSVANGTTFFTSESAPGGNSGMVVASPSTAITIPVLGTSGAVGLVAAAASVGGNRPGVGVHGYGLFNVTNTGVGNSPKGGYFLGETGASAVTFAGSAYGVHGKADTSKGTTNGVGTGNAYGLYGEAVGQANNTCYGVFGTASGGTQNWAIYAANGLQVAAASSTSTTEYINCGAGKFSVQTDRTLSGAGKGAFGNSSGEIGLHNWNNKVSIYVGSPLLERFRVNLDGTINSVYQHAFTYTGSAANDVTQDAVQVRPSAALAANYRGLALYPTSAASTPNTWTDTRCGINSAISYDFSSADAILHSFTGTLTGTSPSGNSNRLFSATMFLSPSGTVAARTIAAGNFVADLLSNASFGGGSGSTLIAISASSDNNHATLSWDVTQGVNSQAGTTRVGGTVTTAQCYVARPLYTGTTTNAYGYYAMSPAGGGTLVNAYGVYIESQAAASTLKYGLYQAGTGDLNLFAGTVGIGASAESRTSLYLSSAQLDGATPCAIKIGATFFGSGINYSILSIPGVRFSTTTTEFRHYGAQNIAASGGALPAGYIQTGLYIDDMTAATTNYAIYTKAGTVRVGDDLKLATVGKGLYVKEGANATMGVATLIGGTVVVNTTKVTATSRIYLTGQNASGTIGELGISARVVGTSFTITSLSGTDTRDVAWMIVEPA